MRDLSFFRGVPQLEVREGGHALRVPAFYYDVTHFSVGFLAPLEKLRELLPSAEICPLRATPRHGLLHIGVFEYRDSDAGPYNEVSISVAALPDVSAPVGTGLLKAVREGPTAYIWQLPVTTEIARYLGVEFYGFPKFLAQIEIQARDGWGHCRLSEKDETIFDLRLELPEAAGYTRYHYHTLSLRGGRLVRAEVSMYGKRGSSRMRNQVRLACGEHPLGRQLDGLGLGRVLEVTHAPLMQSILTSPVESFPA